MAVITGTAAAETLPGTAGKDTITGAGGDDASIDIAVDADGIAGNGFEVTLATLKTVDAIAVGQDVLVGN